MYVNTFSIYQETRAEPPFSTSLLCSSVTVSIWARNSQREKAPKAETIVQEWKTLLFFFGSIHRF